MIQLNALLSLCAMPSLWVINYKAIAMKRPQCQLSLYL